MTTNRFQPGDKVRAGIFTADIGLTPNRVYTVHHVDDFGQVQPDSARHHHYHPSHFELVMRKVWDAAATYSLKDGEGDWWFLDMAPNAVPLWRMVDRTDVVYDAEDGIEEIARDYGIDGTPTAPETYCLKDEDGDWWVSEDGETFRWVCECHGTAGGATSLVSDLLRGIDAEPIPAMKGMEPTHAEVDEVQSWPDRIAAYVEDQRIAAWDRVARHPVFNSCYEEERPLIDAMMAKLDRIYSEGASPAASTGNSTEPSLHFEIGDRVRIVRTAATDASYGIADGMRDVGDEFTVMAVGTNGPRPYALGDAVYRWHTDDLEKVTADLAPRPAEVDDCELSLADDILAQWERELIAANTPAPLQPGDAVLVWGEVERVYPTGSATVAMGRSGTERVSLMLDAIVRPADGATPPWVEKSPTPAEPAGRAIVGAGILYHVRFLSDCDWLGSDGVRRKWAEVCALGDVQVHYDAEEAN